MPVTRRAALGILSLILVSLIVVLARLAVERPAPQTRALTFGTTTFTIEADRTTVWQEGDCVALRWQVEGIHAIWWSQGPTVGETAATWCLSRQVDFPFFTIQLADDSRVSFAPFSLQTLRTPLLITLIPLILLAGWCFRLHQALAHTVERLPLTVRAPFMVGGRVQPLLVTLFLGINLIVLWNAVNHDSLIGYDAEGHYQNVQALAAGHLPDASDSGEFFSPPLPYALPALYSRLSGLSESCGKPQDVCYEPVRKLGQLQNVAISLAACFALLRIGTRLRPESAVLRGVALGLLGLLPVYYKTFAMLRGEPFVLLLTLLLCDRLLALLERPPQRRDALILGVEGGLLLLSRQWGALVLVGVGLWWLIFALARQPAVRRLLWPGLGAGLIALLLGGWFYLALLANTGSALAFNRAPAAEVKPADFFTGLGGDELFTYPFSPGYDGQALPIFYTEIWGDYFGYFHVQRPPIAAPLPAELLAYPGRVNFVALLPTLFLLAGLGDGLRRTLRLRQAQAAAPGLLTIVTAASLAGFVWFLARYPSGDADTAKATYVLQIFPLLALLGGALAESLQRRSPAGFRLLVILLAGVAAHTSLMYFSAMN